MTAPFELMPVAETLVDFFGSNVVIVALGLAELNDGYSGGDGNEADKACIVTSARAALTMKTDRNIEYPKIEMKAQSPQIGHTPELQILRKILCLWGDARKFGRYLDQIVAKSQCASSSLTFNYPGCEKHDNLTQNVECVVFYLSEKKIS